MKGEEKAKEPIRVLVIPSGTQTAVEIIKSLKDIPRVELFGLDTDPLNVGFCWVGPDNRTLAPPLASSEFFPFLEGFVRGKEIDIIYPTHDFFLLPFAECQQIGGARCIVPNAEAVRITRSKGLTYEYFKGIIRVPKVYEPGKVSGEDYPVFIKPKVGRGSEEAFRVESEKELEVLYSKIDDPVLMEYLPGKEYTVDCLCDLDGQLLVAVVRERIKIIRGISAIARVVENPEVQEMAAKIAQNLKLPGSWFFQAREDREGIPTLLEINARIGGTASLTRTAGVNIPWLTIRIFEGEKIREVPPPKIDLVVTRYFAEKYLREEK